MAIKDTRTELVDLLPKGKSAGNLVVDQITDEASRVSNKAKGDAAHLGLLGQRRS